MKHLQTRTAGVGRYGWTKHSDDRYRYVDSNAGLYDAGRSVVMPETDIRPRAAPTEGACIAVLSKNWPMSAMRNFGTHFASASAGPPGKQDFGGSGCACHSIEAFLVSTCKPQPSHLFGGQSIMVVAGKS